MARKVFFSFHYDNDVFRVQQIRNIGALEENKPVTANDWEQVKRGGDASIKRWINENLGYKSCLIVLIGSETANRKWVKYEIEKAWNDGKAVLGIYIHNLNCPRNGYSAKGTNPFEQFDLQDGRKLSSVVKCYNPSSSDAYNDIRNNIEDWIEEAIALRK
jgi:hypothetical protein